MPARSNNDQRKADFRRGTPLTVLGWESPEQEICGPANIVKYNKGDRDIKKEMDFSQYFWSVPSRQDHLAGTLQRQESLLETFLVNSLQVSWAL